jgi:hypothetical protein
MSRLTYDYLYPRPYPQGTLMAHGFVKFSRWSVRAAGSVGLQVLVSEITELWLRLITM